MRTRVWQIGVLCFVLAGSGCTGTDVLSTGVQPLTIEFEATPTTSRFEAASFIVTQLELRSVPGGGPADQILDGIEIGVLPVADHAVDLVSGTGTTVTTNVTAGIYEVTRVTVTRVGLTDENPPTTAPTCEEFIASYRTEDLNGITMFATPPQVTVDPATGGTLKVRFDADTFIAAFQGAFNCATFCPDNPSDPFCLGNYVRLRFTNESVNFLSFP